MLPRIAEGVAVGTATAGVLWAFAHPGRTGAKLETIVRWVGEIDFNWATASFALAVFFSHVAVVMWAGLARRTISFGDSCWEFELHMPSWPTRFLGAAALCFLTGQVHACHTQDRKRAW